MVTLFLDISEIRALFLTTRDKNTGQVGYLTMRDFKSWLFSSVNWLNYIYTDFTLGADNEDLRFSPPVTGFEGIHELHDVLHNSLNHPLLEGKEILSSYGFLYGDLLYFEITTEKGLDNNE